MCDCSQFEDLYWWFTFRQYFTGICKTSFFTEKNRVSICSICPGRPQDSTLNWGKRGTTILGLYWGAEDFQRQNWEGVLNKVRAKLSKLNWLLPLLSYRGRSLIINNQTSSSLWHRLIVLVPPPGLVKEMQVPPGLSWFGFWLILQVISILDVEPLWFKSLFLSR